MQQSTRSTFLDLNFSTNGLRQFLERNEGSVLSKFVGDKNYPKESLMASMSESLANRISNGGIGETLSDEERDKVSGMVIAEEAKWDSEHFGHRMGKLSLALFDADVDANLRTELVKKVQSRIGSEMLSARISLMDSKTIQALERLGAILTDVLLTYRFDLVNQLQLDHVPKTTIDPAEENETNELVEMGRSIFNIDRFHNDPRLSPKSNELYSKWVHNSVNGFADEVLVARAEDEIAGFITCKLERIDAAHRSGTIDLVGVKPTLSGLGIGRDLVQAALRWFSGKVPSVYVGTQAANTRAVRLYEACKFTHVLSEATLHLWANRESER